MNPLRLAAIVSAFALPTVASAATPMTGVPVNIRRGFFTETDLGTFFTLGGEGKSPSNAQAYLSLSAGYDVYAEGDHFVSLGLGFGMGTSAGACFGDIYTPDAAVSPCQGAEIDPDTGKNVILSDNWTVTSLEATALYGYQVYPRLMATGRLLGGVGFIQPQAFEGVDNPVPLAGAGLGVEYATRFEHFSLGLDLAGKFFIGPNVPGIAIAPRVKYTF